MVLVGVVLCQADDGVRDAQESRGLGDVYKQQDLTVPGPCNGRGWVPATPPHSRKLPGQPSGSRAQGNARNTCCNDA